MTSEAFVPVTGTVLDPDSYLGRRVEGNRQRLRAVDLDPLLAGFRARPGSHPWIGEHIGKWIHAATLTWRDTRDERLERKLAGAVRDLIATQEPDGYLGTYEPELRFGLYPGADWDVWTHKYCLIGLLTYHEWTGDAEALRAACRAGDLLVQTFGEGDGRRSILAAGTHVGMAATSVLEPVVLLHRHTGDGSYLAFADYIVRAWDCDGGPRVRSTLLATGRVSEVGNGKAYEMLSNILGLVELAEATGDAGHLTAAVNAWEDVVGHHLYVTGTASFGEHFHRPGELPDSVSVNMGETCVTVTWLQLTARLLELTGEARYAAELERTLFNHLAGAQAADGSAWSYYTPLDGYREHGSGISCCISSGPRGMALAPQCVMSRRADELAITLLQSARAVVELGGVPVGVRIATAVPWAGGARVTFALDRPAAFGVRVRVPDWAQRFDGAVENGWLTIPARRWSDGDEIAVDFDAGWRQLSGDGWNEGRVSLAWGPLVLAYARDRGVPAALDFLDPEAPPSIGRWTVRNAHAPGGRIDTTLSPFADATGPCRVWLDATEPRPRLSAFDGAAEAQSSGDPRRASFNDYDAYSFAATQPGDAPAWFALTLDAPVSFRRVVFAHGRSLVHGGWFDTSEGKPLLQIRQAGEWVTVAAIDAYPETDAERDGNLDDGHQFDVRLDATVRADGLRVIGRGAHGRYPPRRFATCALLQAFG
jgi:DUF1680 family protein